MDPIANEQLQHFNTTAESLETVMMQTADFAASRSFSERRTRADSLSSHSTEIVHGFTIFSMLPI